MSRCDFARTPHALRQLLFAFRRLVVLPRIVLPGQNSPTSPSLLNPTDLLEARASKNPFHYIREGLLRSRKQMHLQAVGNRSAVDGRRPNCSGNHYIKYVLASPFLLRWVTMSRCSSAQGQVEQWVIGASPIGGHLRPTGPGLLHSHNADKPGEDP